ncbi:MAG: ABC transporter permease [Vicingaceae bacterium]
MALYLLKRILLFIPSLLGLSLIFFFLSTISPGDPVLNRLESSIIGEGAASSMEEIEQLKALRIQLGLNKPLFYFKVHRKTLSDTAYKIPSKQLRENLNDLSYQLGSWELVNEYYKHWKQSTKKADLSSKELVFLNELIQISSVKLLKEKVRGNQSDRFSNLEKKILAFEAKEWSLENYLPRFHWNGLNNQYHQWIFGLFRGDLGKSYIDSSPVNIKVSTALKTTTLLSLISILLAFLIGIPLAIYAANQTNSLVEKFISTLLYCFYALPTFWVATLLIIALGGGDYLSWFPSYGLGDTSDSDSIWEAIQIKTSHLVLPIFCLTYGSIAIVYKQLKNALNKELQSEYVLTAKAKGLSKQTVLVRHAFKNAAFPLVTLAGRAFPAIVSGSFIVEFIFSINGIGKLTLDSFLARDFPVIFAIVMLASFMTLLGVLLADIIYQLLDPRINLQKSH